MMVDNESSMDGGGSPVATRLRRNSRLQVPQRMVGTVNDGGDMYQSAATAKLEQRKTRRLYGRDGNGVLTDCP